MCQLQYALGLAAVRREAVVVERECISSKGGGEETQEDCLGAGWGAASPLGSIAILPVTKFWGS